MKFADILKVQNCLFMYQFEQNNALATSFPVLHCKGKHNYQTTFATQNLLDVPLARANKYGKGSVKNQCVRDWNNFKKKFPQIPENRLSYMKIKRTLKQAIFDQNWTLLFTTINFYMRTLYYFYFLSSRIIQLRPCFMILLVLIFIVNQNVKLLNRHSILLLFSVVLLPFCLLYFFSRFCLHYYCPIIIIVIYLLLLLFTHLFTYFYLFIFIWSSTYLFCGLDLYKV